MKLYEEIIEEISSLYRETDTEEVMLVESLGRVLQQKVIADLDMPPFNRSAVDGYACRKEDLGNKMEVREMIAAGTVPLYKIGLNQCSKVMTGATVPGGADLVFMTEDTEIISESWVRCTNLESKINIAYYGEDYRQGDALLEKGTIIKSEHLAVIAGAGLDRITVSVLPRIGLIITGTELVAHNELPVEGKIRNTNGVQIISLLKELSITATYYGIIPDEREKLHRVFRKSIAENDMVIITGGAAAGDFDFVPDLIREEGYSILWERTGLKPGNPMSFGMKNDSCVFGLSGNPVSSLVQFKYLVVPVIYHLLGAAYKPLRIKASMKLDYFRMNASRLGIIPVRINADGEIEEIPFNGSAHINALSMANAFMEIPAGKNEIKQGEQVYVRPL
ncbi:molybdopterin molybdotransferase MoeA [Bacteroidota bacterium]